MTAICCDHCGASTPKIVTYNLAEVDVTRLLGVHGLGIDLCADCFAAFKCLLTDFKRARFKVQMRDEARPEPL